VSEDNLRLGCAVNAAGLDTDENATLVLQENVCIQSNNTGLIGLGDIGEDDIDHGNEQSVSHRVLVTGLIRAMNVDWVSIGLDKNLHEHLQQWE
jgi:hypothetical protein